MKRNAVTGSAPPRAPPSAPPPPPRQLRHPAQLHRELNASLIAEALLPRADAGHLSRAADPTAAGPTPAHARSLGMPAIAAPGTAAPAPPPPRAAASSAAAAAEEERRSLERERAACADEREKMSTAHRRRMAELECAWG